MEFGLIEMNSGVHVALGSIALLGGLLAILSKKGSKRHVQGGWTFALAMIPVVITTLVAMGHNFLPLAIVLAVAELYLVPSALLSVNNDKRYFVPVSIGLMIPAALLCAFTMLQFIRVNFIQDQGIFIGPLLLAALFGGLLVQDIMMLRKRPVIRNTWLRRHFTRMIYAYTIAVMALVRIGVDFGLSFEMTVIIPLLIATGFVVYVYRLYPVK